MNKSKTLLELETSMRPFLLISACFLIASCAKPQIEYRNIKLDIPEELRTPITVPDRNLDTLADVGLILTDYAQGLDAANGKIVAIDEIYRAAE